MSVTADFVETELESLEYRDSSETYRAVYDRDRTVPSMAVVATLSEVMDCEPGELDPLYASVDADALDELVRVREGTVGDVTVTFPVADYAVTVHSYGVVAVTPGEREQVDDPAKRVSPT